jgi:hypothetical protein
VESGYFARYTAHYARFSARFAELRKILRGKDLIRKLFCSFARFSARSHDFQLVFMIFSVSARCAAYPQGAQRIRKMQGLLCGDGGYVIYIWCPSRSDGAPGDSSGGFEKRQKNIGRSGRAYGCFFYVCPTKPARPCANADHIKCSALQIV